jgi:hypothetical protein
MFLSMYSSFTCEKMFRNWISKNGTQVSDACSVPQLDMEPVNMDMEPVNMDMEPVTIEPSGIWVEMLQW